MTQATTLQSAQYLATVLSDLHSVWTPHPGQIEVGRSLFHHGKRRVFVRCGRKWGKTELSIYTLYRWALTIPNGQFYYIAPYYNQASEIIWKPGRLQNFLGKHKDKYIESIHETDKRVICRNGSFIKLVGSDNYEAGRGFNPDGAVGDEYKDSDIRFYHGFMDNLIAKKAPILLVGTPPETFDHFFVRTEDDFKQDPRGAYFKKPTWDNPHIDAAELELEKQSAIAKGEWAKYMREIEAEIVPGGANAIFPMLEVPRYDEKGSYIGESVHVKKHQTAYEYVGRNYKDWDFHALFDPGSSVCFAALFAAVNRFTREVAILDEIYETVKAKTSTRQIYPRAMVKMNELCSRKTWRETFDYAAQWFAAEVQHEYKKALTPCQKDVKTKSDKLSVIKDFLLHEHPEFPDWRLIFISDRCRNLLNEMATYATDEKDKIPKKNDHAIDCLRYLFNAANLKTPKRSKKTNDPERRVWTPEDDDEFEDGDESRDLFEDITNELYD
jgi:hypothetical protein